MNAAEYFTLKYSPSLLSNRHVFQYKYMKRDFSSLQKEGAGSDSDARLRRRLNRLNDAEVRAQRLAAAKKAEIAKLEADLKKWKTENVRSATNFILTEPEAIPLGA